MLEPESTQIEPEPARDLGLSQPEPLKEWRLLNTGFKKLFRHHELIMKGAKFEPRTGASASQQSALPMSLHISGVSICANFYPPLALTYLKKAFKSGKNLFFGNKVFIKREILREIAD